MLDCILIIDPVLFDLMLQVHIEGEMLNSLFLG